VILYGSWETDTFFIWNGNYDVIETCNLIWAGPMPLPGNGDPTGGGGGGEGGGNAPAAQRAMPDKPKCKQEKTPEERRAVAEQLGKVATSGLIGNIRDAFDKNGSATEGILFDIYDSNGLKAALKNAGFKTNTIFNTDHRRQVGGTIFNTSDNRSDTTGAGNLGPDTNSNGIARSLQVVIGPNNKIDNQGNKFATGYSDLDCSNPAQDVVSVFKHLSGR
ncbi:MAG: hypothetical protein ACRD6X_21625, partial [Pyrinomonadaceae bacterium]